MNQDKKYYEELLKKLYKEKKEIEKSLPTLLEIYRDKVIVNKKIKYKLLCISHKIEEIKEKYIKLNIKKCNEDRVKEHIKKYVLKEN